MARDPFHVFFSWQSDLPKKCNWTLIEDSLKRAAGAVGSDPEIEVDPVVDRDTAGLPGTPDIAQSILDKIDRCGLFVADVSIVLGDASGRRSPNPNVLIEIGYAARSLGWDRVVLLFNEHFGPLEALPFDIRSRRIKTYRAAPEDPPASARNDLARFFEVAIRAVLSIAPATRERTFSMGRSVTTIDHEWLAMGVPADVPRKLVILGPPEGAVEIERGKLLSCVMESGFKLAGWGGSGFPADEDRNVNEHREADCIRRGRKVLGRRTGQVDEDTFLWAAWRSGDLAQCTPIREAVENGYVDNPAINILAIEWAMYDLVQPLQFLRRFRDRVAATRVPFRVGYRWQLGQGRRLAFLDRNRVGFSREYRSSADVWEHGFVVEPGEDPCLHLRDAAESLCWQFGWDQSSGYLDSFLPPLIAGHIG